MNFRRIATAAGLALAGLLLVTQVRQLLADPTIWPPDDFVEYWAAARVTLAGDNPYDGAKLLPLQQAAGRDTDKPIMMWNPPWALAVVLPLGLIPARAAQLLWLLVNFAAIAYCGDRLWLMAAGSRDKRWIGWAAALVCLPTLFALQSGQIGPLLLLGAVLFLECERRGWSMAAGAATVLLAVKPHLAYLVWAAILGDALVRRRGGMILGGILGGLIATAIPLGCNAQVVHQYVDAMVNRTPEEWLSPTWGSVLRLAFGEGRFKLQFVPMLFGLAWFAFHWHSLWWHRHSCLCELSAQARMPVPPRTKPQRLWNWTEQLPLLLLVSFATAPYGAWPFDMVLLLPAAVKLLSLRRNGMLVALLAINAACLVMNICQTGSFAFIWVAPALLALYWAALRPTPAPHPESAIRPAVAV